MGTTYLIGLPGAVSAILAITACERSSLSGASTTTTWSAKTTNRLLCDPPDAKYAPSPSFVTVTAPAGAGGTVWASAGAANASSRIPVLASITENFRSWVTSPLTFVTTRAGMRTRAEPTATSR